MSDKANKPESPVSATVVSSDDANLKRGVEVSPSEDPASVSSDTKRPKILKEDDEDVPDLAPILGIKVGDRLEVEWDIEDESSPEDETTPDEPVKTRWWRATLLEHDGMTEDGCAIRTLEYDAWPEGGFPDKSREGVIFIGRDKLVDMETHEQMQFRLLSEDNSSVFFVRVDEVESMVNSLLEGALSKAAGSFNSLSRAQQGAIADKIASKKEKLIELLQNYMNDDNDSTNRVVTAADAHRLLTQAMLEG